MKRLIWSTAAALLLFAAHPAQAQNSLGGKVVTTCGTPGAFPTTGRPGPFTVDVNGTLCINASGGGGSAITAADGAIVGLGAIADTAYTGSGSAAAIAILKGIYASINSAIPGGTAIIGKVGIDQTTPGTTNAVAFTNSTIAVTNAGTFATQSTLAAETTKVIGTVNQGTSPWASNVAQINGVTPLMGNGATGTGSARVTIASDGTAISTTGYMSVKVDQTTDGTTNAVSAHGAVNVTPTNCGGTITSGGTAQNAHSSSATLRGMTIANLDTTEVMWVSFTSTAAASDTQSYPLAPATATTFAGLSSYTTPLGFGYNTALSVIAATTGHKWACTRW